MNLISWREKNISLADYHKFSITKAYLMELFKKNFYSDFISNYQIKMCDYYVKDSDKYSFGHSRIDCDFRDRSQIDFECKNCGRVVIGFYKESNYSLSIAKLHDDLTCDEYLIKNIIK